MGDSVAPAYDDEPDRGTRPLQAYSATAVTQPSPHKARRSLSQPR